MKARPKKKKLRASNKGALLTVSLLLIGSAVLRFGETAGQAYASGTAIQNETSDNLSDQTSSSEHNFSAMLEAFQEREAKIAEQEAALETRMHALTLAEEQIDKKLAELTEAEERLSSTIAQAETAAIDDLDRLTKVYESMKPKQAAALFEEMSPDFAAGFLGRMRPDAAAAIMAGLSPESAHTFSVVLAGRNAEVSAE